MPFVSQIVSRTSARLRLTIQSLVVSTIIVVAAFPDVVFFGRSISMVDSFISMNSWPLQPRTLYPEASHRAPHHGFSDSGGAVWQSEPMIQFMRRVLSGWESPYWNPYSATGALGPETLVDQKFSPHTLLIAAAGGGVQAFHFVTLSLFVLALAVFYAALRRFLGLSFLAATAGAIVYLLNGFHVANLSSNVLQVYLYLPMCLFALWLLAERPSARRLLLATAAHIPVFMTTFMPTTVMGLTGVWGLALAYAGGMTHGEPLLARARYVATVVVLQIAAALLAVVILAPLYLPVLEALFRIGAIDAYSQRVFYPVTLNNLIGVFTPKHVFESYNAIDPNVWGPMAHGYIGNVAFHFGIAGMAAAAAGLAAWQATYAVRATALAAAALLAVAFGRLYAVPGFGALVENLPLLRNIGAQYWWILVAVLVPVAAALGIEAFVAGRARRWAPFGMVLLVVWAAGVVGFNYVPSGAIAYPLEYVLFSLALLAALLILTTVLTGRAGAGPRLRAACAVGLVALMFVEYSLYINNQRYDRVERVLRPPPAIAFLQQNAGDFRVANFGSVGMPPEWGSMYGVPQIGSLNNNVLPHYLSFFQRTLLADVSARWGQFPTLHRAKDDPHFNFDALNLVSARYLVIATAMMPKRLASLDPARYPRRYESPAVTVVENSDALPRVYLVPQLRSADKTPAEHGLWARNVAVTEDERLLELARLAGLQSAAEVPAGEVSRVAAIPDAAARIVSSGHANLVIDVNTDRPALLVISDAWYPGWRAQVSGREIYIGRVNEAFRGVVLPAGSRRLELTYAPRSLPAALALCAIGLAIAVALLLGRHRFGRWFAYVVSGAAPVNRRIA